MVAEAASGKLVWLDGGGKEIPNGALVALSGKVVGRHGGNQVAVECAPGQRVIVPATKCDQAKGAGKQALLLEVARCGALQKQLVACQKEKESFKEHLAREQGNSASLQKRLDEGLAQLAGVRAEFDAYVKGNQGAAVKGG
jgi:hypothetical protein